uniref:Arginine-glutamic acid dipeptide repeats protein-like n=1 Tax=Phallusia mammillata TaxID=59560 RepID=A0A6F9DQ05_9ASCI|nr:arginine-glutamic acid dipeptide repeats protein-like [Phallusia mammillata]
MSVDSKDSLWLQGTRRNTRSSSNQEKEAKEKSLSATDENRKDQKDDGKKRDINSTGHIVRGEHNEVVEYKTDDEVSYKLFDSAYIATERSDNPYFIATIQEIKVSKKDNAVVVVKWYYRPGEVPDSVYQMLVKDRLDGAEDQKEKELILNNECRNRELFVADDDSTDVFPVSHLRGKCSVKHFNDFHEVKNYDLKPDTFFYILGYNPETRRLSSTQGEVRVGPSHQWTASTRGIFQKAIIPDLLPPMSPCTNQVNADYEELMWKPRTNDCDLIMFLHSARSMAAFAGMCDGGSTEEGCVIASRDETTINALNVLFQSNGDTRAALQVLVKNPLPLTIERKWTEDQVKRFQKGLRQNGKNFFKIRRDLLPNKDTSELVEFYYLWKKVQESLMVQPQSKNRRQASLKRNSKQRNPASEGGEGSSSDVISDSEESDKDNGMFRCKHCCTTKSEDWNLGGKEGVMLCTKCRIFFKKYGGDNQVDIDFDHDTPSDVEDVSRDTPIFDKQPSNIQPPPFMFKPIKLSEDHQAPLPPDADDSGTETQDAKPCKRQWESNDQTSSSDEKMVEEKRCKTELDAETKNKIDDIATKKPAPTWPINPDATMLGIKPETSDSNPSSVTSRFPTNAGLLPAGFAPYAQYPHVYTGAASQIKQDNASKTKDDNNNLEAKTDNDLKKIDNKTSRTQSDQKGPEHKSFPSQFLQTQSTPFYPVVKPELGPHPVTMVSTGAVYPSENIQNPPRDANKIVSQTTMRPAESGNPQLLSKPKEQVANPYPLNYGNMPRPLPRDITAQTSSDQMKTAHPNPIPHHHHDHKARTHQSGEGEHLRFPEGSKPHHSEMPHRSSDGHLARTSSPRIQADDEQSAEEYIHDILPSHHITIPADQPWPAQFHFYDDGIPCRSMKSSNNYVYSKTRLRGYANKLCSRTDLVWVPNPEPRSSKQDQHSQASTSASGSVHRTPQHHQESTPHRHFSSEKDRDLPKPKSREVKTPTSLESHHIKREPSRSQAIPRTTPVHVPHHRSTPTHTPTFDAHRPTPSHASPYGSLGPDTPALRTLRQYATFDSQREALNAMITPGQNVHPLLAQSERDLRERELRERELRERMPKQSFDAKLMESLESQMNSAQVIAMHGVNPGVVQNLMTQHALEQAHHQQQVQGMLFGVPGAAHQVPGFPDFLAQHPELQLQQNAAERMANERIHADRVAALEQYRMELLHNHQHSHVHSHLHLHPSNAQAGPAAAAAVAAGLPPSASADYLMALQAQTHHAIAAGLDPLQAASMGHPMFNLGGIRAPHAGQMITPGLPAIHPGMVRPTENPFQQYLSASATHHLQAVAHEQSIMEQQRMQEEYIRATLGHKPPGAL